MGFSDDVNAVKANVSEHSMNIFVEYFTKYPQHQSVFKEYVGKDPASLKSVDRFKTHVTNVVTMLVGILEKADDAATLEAECKKLAAMPQHKTLNVGQFEDVGKVLVPYLEKTTGGACDSGAWTTKYANFTKTLAGCL